MKRKYKKFTRVRIGKQISNPKFAGAKGTVLGFLNNKAPETDLSFYGYIVKLDEEFCHEIHGQTKLVTVSEGCIEKLDTLH